MKSKKAKKFIEEQQYYPKYSDDCSVRLEAVIQVVELAEQEMQEKAIEEFCQFICSNENFNDCDYHSCKECRKIKPCASLQIFINQLNK